MEHLQERRQHPRFVPHEELMAFNQRNFGQVINISVGGLRYKSLLLKTEQAETPPHIALLNSSGGHYLDQLPCQIVQSVDSPPLLPSSNTIIRETSVKFVGLTPKQLESLNAFLIDNTKGAA